MYYFIDGCEFCGEFKFVALQEVDATTRLCCDTCLGMIEYEEEPGDESES